MPQPRKKLISLSDTPYYHCMSRCVRRAFLCGVDDYSGKSYEHRRDWLEDKLHEVAEVFAIKLCAYAVMSNHYHVVLHVRSGLSDNWSNYEVVERWHRLFAGTQLSQMFAKGVLLSKTEQDTLSKDINIWRQRLSNISWFMRIVNEAIARRANDEDKCTGHFWEGRFKSQALLDDKALLACMAYVDLNPIRSASCKTPETSAHTCVSKRIRALKGGTRLDSTIESFVGNSVELTGLPFTLRDYLELIDWTGRIIREDKQGAISGQLPPILERLAFNSKNWESLTSTFEQQFSHWVGQEHRVRQIYRKHKYKRAPSTEMCRSLLG